MSRMPAARRREQLLDTAANLFAVHGYAGATTSQIARAAGVTEPIIYRHFPSKRDMFVALIERTGAETIRLWEHELRAAPDPAERLRRVLRANPMVTAKGRGAYRVIIQAMTEVEDPKIQQALNEHIHRLHDFLAAEVAGRRKRGTSPKVRGRRHRVGAHPPGARLRRAGGDGTSRHQQRQHRALHPGNARQTDVGRCGDTPADDNAES